jgi:EAL domain-containing protein (putative c-di-GMP-specific phosphodiesterase class I)
MYEAKDSGRNTYKFYTDDMTEKAFARIKLESKLRHAIKDEDFALYFQPQVNAKTNTITGMETLVRWEHSSMGFIPPNDFIPIAEDTGLIIPLGFWILKKGMQQIVQWYEEGLTPGVLAINLSMMQLQKHRFISTLMKILDETMCKPQWIELEITESQVMKNPEETILTLQKISKLGIKIAIDDFGTGYSSLSYLKRLPIDRLKIDRSFIQEIPENEEDIAIALAIIALAASLNLEVIAEGVETKKQKEFLVENGCSDIQGYLYAKPMSADEMKKMLRNNVL